MSRQLLILLGLVVATIGVVNLRPVERREDGVPIAERLPEAHDGWGVIRNTSSDILPTDPRAVETVRQTYARNGDVVMVSVARYLPWNHPDHRPLPDFIVATPGPRRVTAAALPLDPNHGVTVPLVFVHRHDQRVAVAYWYQVGLEPISGEYTLRYRVFLDTLRGRPRRLLLIRLAAADRVQLSEFVQGFYPRLRNLLLS